MPVLIIKTAAEFLADNDILLVNQIGQESDTGLTKVGYGEWNSLDYYTPVINAFEQVLSGSKVKVPSSFAVKTYVDASSASMTLAAVLANGRDVDATGTINDVTSAVAVDVNNRILYDELGFGAIAFSQTYRLLGDLSAVPSLDYASRFLIDASNNTSVDWGSRLMYSDSGIAVVDWTGNLQLVNDGGQAVLRWATSELMTSAWSYDANYAPFSGRELPDAAWVTASIASAAYITSVAFTDSVNLAVSLGGELTANVRKQNTATVLLTIDAGGLRGDFASLDINQFAGPLSVAKGGTNISSYAVGDILYASGATTLSKLADVAAGSYLRSGGVTTAPLWSTTTLPNTIPVNQILHATSANVLSGTTDFLRMTTGELLLGTTSSLSSSLLIQPRKDQNTITSGLFAINATAGTGAGTAIGVSTSATGLTECSLYAISSSSTRVGMLVANSGVLYSNMGAGLQVGTASNTSLSFWTNDTKRVALTSDGMLIAGTSYSPVLGIANGLYLQSVGTSAGIQAENTSASGSVAGGSIFLTTNDNAAIVNGDRLGAVVFCGSREAGGVVSSALIEAYSMETWSTSQRGSYLVFKTNATGTNTIAERMRITDGGLVGIGMTPIITLDVAQSLNSSSARIRMSNTNSGTAAQSWIYATNNDLNSYALLGTTSTGFTTSGLYVAQQGRLEFYSGNNATSLINVYTNSSLTFATNNTARMVLDSSGNLTMGGGSSGAMLTLTGGGLQVGTWLGAGWGTSPDATVSITKTNGNCTIYMGQSTTVYGSLGWLYNATTSAAYMYISGGNNPLVFFSGGAEKMRLMTTGNFKIAGTAVRATTEGTNHLDIFDGTAPVGTLANGISLYSTAGELRVMDAAGNATLLSPHEKKTNFWIYDSVDTVRKKRLVIDMERMMRAINEKFGFDFVHDFVVK